ncbi:SOS response-associated peptidase family protein [Psychrobacter sp. CAL346-MNA-CIBAN-0220]|uniref:SOS response-associated peptidase family protein n=1 Tax=Psychrobacter sp. CAL346-MNA-CIBAN-0220 TaxID=3140457 RepID=UPI003320B54B
MCSNFEPATLKQIEAILDNQITLGLDSYKNHVYPKDQCPIIISSDGNMKVVMGQFGLSPKWANQPVDYSTYNARLEGIESKKTFEPPFTHNQFCLVPMQAFFEPYYLDGKNDWQRIYRKDSQAFTIAGMFEFNPHFNDPIHTFTLLTHNANNDAFMSRFHRPEKEKRSISLVEEQQRSEYLHASHQEIKNLMSKIENEIFAHKGS